MLKVLNLNEKHLTSQDIAIRFAPKLNALSRMESEILPIDLMLVGGAQEARDLVKYMMDQNSLRQFKQQQAEDEALEQFKDKIPEDFIFVFSKNFHQGVVGLVATKMVQRFHLPAWIGTLDDAGVIKGSSRLPENYSGCLVESMTSARDHLVRFGGHSKAAGFELHESQAQSFREKLGQFFADKKKNSRVEIVKNKTYEFPLTFKELTPLFLKWYDFAGPYGTGFPIPLFLFEAIVIKKIKKLKGGHFKLTLEQDSFQVSGMLFNGSIDQVDDLDSLVNQKINIIGEVQGNYFRGETSIQILIKQIQSIENSNEYKN